MAAPQTGLTSCQIGDMGRPRTVHGNPRYIPLLRSEANSAPLISHYIISQIPVCVSGLQAVGSCINHLNCNPSTVLPALSQVMFNQTDSCDSCMCKANWFVTVSPCFSVSVIALQMCVLQLVTCVDNSRGLRILCSEVFFHCY